MDWSIRPFETADVDAVVRLSLRAGEPVFASTREVVGDELDDRLGAGHPAKVGEPCTAVAAAPSGPSIQKNPPVRSPSVVVRAAFACTSS